MLNSQLLLAEQSATQLPNQLYAIGLVKNTHYYSSIQSLLCWSKLALLHPRNLLLIFAGREILAAYRVCKFICITIHLANKSVQTHLNRCLFDSLWSVGWSDLILKLAVYDNGGLVGI